ncbi:MAG: 16S rRNA (guanine(527)-N(7))-methyltransferase RsmG [Bacteroidota bacterium]|nr:16S rRNA (guanine(527)-N(7))-methyltransferase RsmG [Bacteroidota bacterium]
MEKLLTYFPTLSDLQKQKLQQLQGLYADWNRKINVISRKDIDALYERHVLHALGIAKLISFRPNANVLDIGTGGGFPGVPLAILFPDTNFYLIDSIQKKIRVVQAIAKAVDLNNLKASYLRAEEVEGQFDFVVSRAVTKMPRFVGWVKNKISTSQQHELANGILALKGGDLTAELLDYPNAKVYPLDRYFHEQFFATKAVVHLPL